LITFREMTSDDVKSILEIIEEHDEDDAEEAERDYQDEGIDGQFVMLLNDEVIGISGARLLDNCDRSFQLSWTYVDPEQCGNGYGRQLIQHVIDQLKAFNARKVFIHMSDYVDEDGLSVYAAARHLYQSLHFKIEMQINHYYDEGESLTVLGLLLEDKELDTLDIKPESPKIKFNRLNHIAETETAYSFGWELKRFGKTFTEQDLKLGIDSADQNGATIVLVTFPSNFDDARSQLMFMGFELHGQLQDYYEDGVHEDHFLFKTALYSELDESKLSNTQQKQNTTFQLEN